MLVLSRKKNEGIQINDNIRLVVVEIRGDKVRLGLDAPEDVLILRSELVKVETPPPAPEHECPGGFMGRPPGKHLWSHAVVGIPQKCLWCKASREPVFDEVEVQS